MKSLEHEKWSYYDLWISGFPFFIWKQKYKKFPPEWSDILLSADIS